ncbi:MAG: hypothetical protein V1861_04150 [Candidatus Micrarchaeota archaeon]
MAYCIPRQASSAHALEPGFRKVEPLAEGQRILPETEIRQVFSFFFKKGALDLATRFGDARAKLRELFGASAEIAETPAGGLRFLARLEFLTEDRSLDLDLNQKVVGAGFQLRLHSVPVTEGSPEERFEKRERQEGSGRKIEFFEQRMLRKYVITESEDSSRIDRAAKSAENLLQLASILRPVGISEDLPTNIVPLEKARVSKSPPKTGLQEPLVDGLPSMQGGKAS